MTNTRDVHRRDTSFPSGQSAEQVARVQAWRAAIRSFNCGYIDAYTLLTFGVYASFMTGNTTSAGVHAGQFKVGAAGHSLLPIPFFMLGIFSGTYMVPKDRPRTLLWQSISIAIVLIMVVVAGYAAWPGWLSVMLLSFAMGLTNTTVTSVGTQAVSLGFMTGDLNNLAKEVAEWLKGKPLDHAKGAWDTPFHRVRVLASLWTTFFMGAIVGVVVSSRVGVRMLLLPALTLFALALIERTPAAPHR